MEFWNAKLTLVEVENDSMGAKAFKNGSHVLEVLHCSRTSNQNIINIGVH